MPGPTPIIILESYPWHPPFSLAVLIWRQSGCRSAAWVKMHTTKAPRALPEHSQGPSWVQVSVATTTSRQAAAGAGAGDVTTAATRLSLTLHRPRVMLPRPSVCSALLQGSERTMWKNTPEIRNSECAKRVWGIKGLFYLLVTGQESNLV